MNHETAKVIDHFLTGLLFIFLLGWVLTQLLELFVAACCVAVVGLSFAIWCKRNVKS